MKINTWKLLQIFFATSVSICFALNIYVIGFRFTSFQGESFHPITVDEMYWSGDNAFTQTCATNLRVGFTVSIVLFAISICSLWKNIIASLVIDLAVIALSIVVLVIGVCVTNNFVSQTIDRARIENNDESITKLNFFNLNSIRTLIVLYTFPTSLTIVSCITTNQFVLKKIFANRKEKRNEVSI